MPRPFRPAAFSSRRPSSLPGGALNTLGIVAAFLLASAGAAPAQYVGKVADKNQPVLRAIAVYQYTGSLLKPNASRLVPVAVWDGERYQPGGLYLARPEPLAVAPGTQYVLEQSGVPQGLFDVGSAAQLNGSWVGIGRARPEAAPLAPPRLHTPRQLPVLTGGAGRGKAGDPSSPAASTAPTSSGKDDPTGADGGPTLHRKADNPDGGSTGSSDGPTLHRRDSGTGSQPEGGGSPAPSQAPDPDRPTLHRKGGDPSSGAAQNDAPLDPDEDRPALHRKDSAKDTASNAPPPDPDRPTLHHHADTGAGSAPPADPDRPHLRYGASADNARAQPAMLSDASLHAPSGKPGEPPLGSNGAPPPPVAATVAVSDARPDEPRSFRASWPSPAAEAELRQNMHALALKALAGAVQGSFGPAAGAGDAALKQSASAGQGSFGPQSRSAAHQPSRAGQLRTADGRKAAKGGGPSSEPDPLQDAEFSAWELSPAGGTTYVYSAHTAAGPGPHPIQRYVTVIAQADFAGKPQAVFSQTTRSDTLAQTPALHLLDAVDTKGDRRAQLLFSEQTATASSPEAARAFAIYSLASGKAEPVYATDLGSLDSAD